MKKFMLQKKLAEVKKEESIFNAQKKREGKKNVSYDIFRPSCGCIIFVETQKR